jgi:LacI family transcriptional regulator
MKNPGQPTLEDVARAAKVSTATISRSINEPDKVATATRERIQEAIHKLGYTPNVGGRILASRRSNTVGAIIPTMSNSMFAGGLQAFQQVLAESGVTMLVASSGYDAAEELRQIRSLMTHGADGLLLIGAVRPDETTRFLRMRNIPCVLAWSYHNDDDRVFAGFDNIKAARLITRQVLDLGHRRIAMIAGDATGNDRARDRIEGVKRAIKNHHSQARLTAVLETPYSIQNGSDAFEQLMSDPNPPSAVVCGNDVLAAGAILRAREKGIKVPDNVSITGFDDISLASVVTPALTTIRVPQLEMGQAAARLLLEQLRSETKPTSIEFDTQIVFRESLAAPGKAR